jgi:hypothetical protein
MRIMTFFCHLKLVDRNFARTTLAVMNISHSTFYLTAVQNFTPTDAGYLSPLTLRKKDGAWSYEFEVESNPMPDHLLSEIVTELDKKLNALKIAVH